MRTTAVNRWVWAFAAMPALALGAGCGDDTTAATTGSQGGFGGFGGGEPSPTSSTTTTATTGSGPSTTDTSTTDTSTSDSTSTTDTSSSSGGGDGGNGSSSSSSSQGGGGNGSGGAEPICGDGLINGNDDCDGANLGGLDCESQGFAGGTLSCADDCTLDISQCLTCGNGQVDGDDQCDTDDLAGNTCEDLKFDGGELGCNDDCSFDTTGCTLATCGDGRLNGDEDCEGLDLNGQDCEGLGFVGGILSCNADGAPGECQYDTSLCLTCGNDVVDGDDECDGADLDNRTCLTEGHTGGTLDCTGLCTLDETGCTDFALPGAGALVINEIMFNPSAVGDAVGEYFEVYNPSGTTFQLLGCSVTGTGAGDDQFTIDTDLTIPGGGYITFARTADPGFTGADYVWPDVTGSHFQLANTDDGITIACDGVTVDEVLYEIGANGWPNTASTNGRSISLDPASANSGANDTGGNWCAASTNSGNFPSTDRGTPDNANPSCAGSTVTITDCHLQFPTTISDTEGTAVDVYGRVLATGVTDQNLTGNDNSPAITAMVGFGADGGDPATFTWLPAATNAGYGVASPGFEATFDEYVGTFNIPAAAGSPYDYAFRFSGNGGTSWTYCDTNGGAYAAAQAGQMTALVSTTDYNLIFSTYVERTTGSNKALQIYNYGGSAIDLGACTINLYTNGSTTAGATQVLPSVSLAAGGNFVLCNSSATDFALVANGGQCDLMSSVTNFNGDDAIELVCASNAIDIIGQIGNDPGTAWGTNPDDTDEVILTRDCSVVAGDTDGTNAYDPGPEWTGITYTAVDANAALAAHVCP